MKEKAFLSGVFFSDILIIFFGFFRGGIFSSSRQAPAGTFKAGNRLLRRIMAMYREDAVAYNTLVLAEELSQRLYDADGERRHKAIVGIF